MTTHTPDQKRARAWIRRAFQALVAVAIWATVTAGWILHPSLGLLAVAAWCIAIGMCLILKEENE